MTFPVQTPVQGTGVLGATTTFSLALPSFGSTVTSGNSVAVSMALNTGGGGTTQTISVTDDKSNVYTIGPASIGYFDAFTGTILATAYALNVTNGPKTITVTVGDSVSGTIRIAAAGYEVPGSVTVDVNTTKTQTATSINVAFTTTTAAEYAILSTALSAGNTITSQNNGWTQEQSDIGTASYHLYNNLASSGANSWQATSSANTHVAAAILTFAPGSTPTYNGVNQLDYSVVSGSNSITSTGAAGVGSIAVTAGNLLVAVGLSTNVPSAVFTDSLGNVYSPYSSSIAALNGNNGIAMFWCLSKYTGTASFTLSASGTCNAIYVGQFHTSNPGAGALIAGSGNYQSSIGSGSNNATSGNVPIGATTNLMWGFCFDHAGTLSPSQGSGFTGEAAVWKTYQGGTVAIGKPEDAAMTGTVAATFTTNNPGDAVYTLGAAFSLQPFVPPPVGGPVPRLLFIMP